MCIVWISNKIFKCVVGLESYRVDDPHLAHDSEEMPYTAKFCSYSKHHQDPLNISPSLECWGTEQAVSVLGTHTHTRYVLWMEYS